RTRGTRFAPLGGLAAVAVAATPFACLWVVQVADAPDPLTARAVLDIAIWMAVLATPTMRAAWVVAGRPRPVRDGRPGMAAVGRGGDAARRPPRVGGGHGGRAGPGGGGRGPVAVRGRVRPRRGPPGWHPGGGAGRRGAARRRRRHGRAGDGGCPARGTGVCAVGS